MRTTPVRTLAPDNSIRRNLLSSSGNSSPQEVCNISQGGTCGKGSPNLSTGQEDGHKLKSST